MGKSIDMKQSKNWSGERLETFIYGNVAVEHLHRYSIAALFTQGKTVVDIASGEGYGSSILSKNAAKVTGVDIDKSAVEKAKSKYKAANLEFLNGSADTIPVADATVDVLVSFETIEHHDKHEEMFREIKRVLKPDGMLIMSSPDKKYYTDIPGKQNPFHVKELYADEFAALCANYFSHSKMYLQNCINGNSVVADGAGFSGMKVFTGNYDGIYPKEISPLYNIIIASEKPVPDLEFSIFDGEIITESIMGERIDFVRSSTTFRLGHALLYPLQRLKKIFSR